SILDQDSFGVIVQLMRALCEFDLRNSDANEIKLETLRDFVRFLKILSLYYKASFAFIRFYDPYPGQLPSRNNLVSFFRSLIECCTEFCYYFELLPFEIYSNLLMFLFQDSRSYQLFMHSIIEKDLIGRNEIFKLDNSSPNSHLINFLQENSIINHAFELISSIDETKQCILAKISAIKFLLLLTNVERIMQIVCALKQKIEEKIHASLFQMITCKKSEKDSLIFFKYAFKLIEIIEFHSQTAYLCPLNIIEETQYFDKFYAMFLISQHFPN
ncbi:hypothetical protein MXB_3084, partial [Myxobolus squamalis]